MKTITVSIKANGNKFFRFSGIASSEARDSYGEIIKQHGIDLSLVKRGKVIVNAEHDDTAIGNVELAEIRNGRLYIEGIVYIKTVKAKQFYDRLLKNDPSSPVTLSIEFVNPEYNKNDKSVVNEVVLTGVALIGIQDKPANNDTYAKLLKSVSQSDLFDELSRRALIIHRHSKIN
ncbi:MAG: hypothetical protein IPK68_11160 [Bdellovibrionales bacterium]|nr:hypothetical protein [Bdellovibrionales bacterium]